MKKIFFIISIASLITACTNQEVEFDDFEYQAIYFPFQTPVRTLMLGDEVLGDNSIDLEHAFSIGVAIGGMYENERDREVYIGLAPELANNITNGDGDTLKILPASYYNSPLDKIVIPEGEFFGKIRVELTDDFFQDPDAINLTYVLPVKITDAPRDSVLSGEPSSFVENHDKRNSGDWVTPPKDYTIFGVKYINPYHGVYLLRGRTINTSAIPNDTTFYSARFLTENDFVKFHTQSLMECMMPTLGGLNTSDSFQMMLTFDENAKSISVSQFDESTVAVSGSGKFFTKEDEAAEGYSNIKHRTIYLDYTFESGGDTFHAMDSLVFVDTDVKFEEFEVLVVE